MRNSTLLFLIKKSEREITHICLAMKKRGFGKGRWNGVGGKVQEEKETIEEAAKRETQEEIGVIPGNLNKVAELSFYFPHNPAWDQLMHAYFAEEWQGQPKESEEMAPKWFSLSDLPFRDMWPDDIFWIPEVIKGNILRGTFKFGEGDIVLEKQINIVDKF